MFCGDHTGQEPWITDRAGRSLCGMKILISADMEGATGVTWPADCEPGTEQWQRCRSMFTGDVNATVEGLFAGGATEVLINEAAGKTRRAGRDDHRAAQGAVHGRGDPVR